MAAQPGAVRPLDDAGPPPRTPRAILTDPYDGLLGRSHDAEGTLIGELEDHILETTIRRLDEPRAGR